ncbi:MAG: hypothetical protein K2X38_02060 [Gemmataceae bacterium]|nr:hypothetical protein [Gemmataceae bacterium]
MQTFAAFAAAVAATLGAIVAIFQIADHVKKRRLIESPIAREVAFWVIWVSVFFVLPICLHESGLKWLGFLLGAVGMGVALLRNHLKEDAYTKLLNERFYEEKFPKPPQAQTEEVNPHD